MGGYLIRLIQVSFLLGICYVGVAAWWLAQRSWRTPFRKVMLGFISAGLLVPIVTLPVWNITNSHGSTSARTAMENVGLVIWPTSIILMLLEGSPSAWATVLVCGMSALGNIGIYGTVGVVLGAAYGLLRSRREVLMRE
jgi:hypothetical protein